MQEQYYDVFRMHDARCMIRCYSDVDMFGASMHNGIEIYHDGWDAWYDATVMQIWLMIEDVNMNDKWCMKVVKTYMPEWSRWNA